MGTIPSELRALSSIEVLALEKNEVSGKYSQDGGFAKRLRCSYLTVTGTIQNFKDRLKRLKDLDEVINRARVGVRQDSDFCFPMPTKKSEEDLLGWGEYCTTMVVDYRLRLGGFESSHADGSMGGGTPSRSRVFSNGRGRPQQER